mmetsp:Transcript_8017/g.22112  ORF Transcript_8017/g.22112 Transcript_8017/m.22112 type:complete len:219 (+) Transcript_8017:353-1009(+)
MSHLKGWHQCRQTSLELLPLLRGTHDGHDTATGSGKEREDMCAERCPQTLLGHALHFLKEPLELVGRLSLKAVGPSFSHGTRDRIYVLNETEDHTTLSRLHGRLIENLIFLSVLIHATLIGVRLRTLSAQRLDDDARHLEGFDGVRGLGQAELQGARLQRVRHRVAVGKTLASDLPPERSLQGRDVLDCNEERSQFWRSGIRKRIALHDPVVGLLRRA